MRKPFVVGSLGLLALWSAGCGAAGAGGAASLGSHASRAAVEFPSRDRLAQIAASGPSAAAAAEAPPIWADAWALAGPFPDVVAGPVSADAPVQQIGAIDALGPELAASTEVPDRRVAATPAMACTAREMARFLVGRTGIDERVMRFVLARCGSTAEQAWLETMHAEVDPAVDEAAFVAAYGAQLRAAGRARFDAFARNGATQVGIAVVREGGRATVVFVGVAEELELATRAPLVEGDGVVLRGRLTSAAQAIEAYVTFGPSDFARCTVARDVALPEVAVRCPMHLEDTMARVDVIAQRPGRLVGHRVGRVLLRRDAAAVMPPLSIDAALAAATPAGTHDAALLDAILARANALRAETGRAPLSLELAQSATVQGLAPSWFAAEEEGQAEAADLISLGLVAGWDVSGGTIRDAHLGATMTSATRNAGEWLALMMEEPFTRAVLLDPEMSAAAIGARWDPDRSAFVGLVVTYAFFEREEPSRAQDRVLAALTAARAARGLPPPVLVGDVPGLGRAVLEVRRGARAPGEALESAMNETAQRTGRPVRALLLEGLALGALPWAEEIVARPVLRLGVGVSWYRVPGAAWGQYAVMSLVIE